MVTEACNLPFSLLLSIKFKIPLLVIKYPVSTVYPVMSNVIVAFSSTDSSYVTSKSLIAYNVSLNPDAVTESIPSCKLK